MPPSNDRCVRPASLRAQVFLGLVTVLCLVPFSNKAFNIDDTLFVWAARQIAQHPLDPYGFKLNWDNVGKPMWKVTKNPPLACYYSALVGSLAGWSERALHLAFLAPALGVILGTYHLARRFTDSPAIAAGATLFTPGFLVSASSVMCDTMMLALWILAAILWIEGLEPRKPLYLAASALLIAAAALTKYFGASLIPLLLAYSLARQRRLGSWVWYLLTPALILLGYEFWTKAFYGQGLLSEAMRFAKYARRAQKVPKVAAGLVDLSFLGGTALTGLTFAPAVWSRKQIVVVTVLAALAALPLGMGWLDLGVTSAPHDFSEHHVAVSAQLAFCNAAAISVLALAIADTWKSRDAGSLFLMVWVLGTFLFAGFLNWANNARSILPLIPAVGILLARRLDRFRAASSHRFPVKSTVPLVVAAILSLWITWGDTKLANSARTAAALIAEKTRNQPGAVWFEGHWGFQYYMQSFGARPVDVLHAHFLSGDFLAVAENNTVAFDVRREYVRSKETIEIKVPTAVSTLQATLGAGFYAWEWGPLPFAFGLIPVERYDLLELAPLVSLKRQTECMQVIAPWSLVSPNGFPEPLLACRSHGFGEPLLVCRLNDEAPGCD